VNDIPEEEAKQILSMPRVCEDPSDWVDLPRPPGTREFEQGLIDVNGERSGYVVSMLYNRSPKTKLMTLKFSVFQQGRRGDLLGRVYQMQITSSSYDPQDAHGEAHEHVGSGRYAIPGWERWTGFNDALAYFSTRTNITFSPQIEDPEDFKLKS